MSRQERILLVRLSHLGDVVHALPVFHALRAARPEARIAWAIQPEFAPLVEGLAGLERTLHFGRRRGARAWLALRDELAAFEPNLTVDAQGNLKSALVTLASGAPRRVGLARGDWREPLGAVALTERAPPAAPSGVAPHAMERMLALARHVAPADFVPRLDPSLGDAELADAAAALNAGPGCTPEDGAGVVVQLARAGDVRSWPLEHFETLVRELRSGGRRVLLVSGPKEASLGVELARRIEPDPRVRHWVGQRGLRELAAAFTLLARAGWTFLGCDSGPLHLAAACGLPVVALSGPQDARRTGPWPVPPDPDESDPRASASPHRVVRAAAPPECAPCLARTCSHPRGPVCMGELDPARALAALVAAD